MNGADADQTANTVAVELKTGQRFDSALVAGS